MIEKLNDVADLLFALYEDESDKESKEVRKQQFDTVIDAMLTIQRQQSEIVRLKERVPKKGEWLQTDKPDITATWHPHCSVCGKEVTNYYAFCPFCGTDMRDSYEYISNMT